MSATLVTPNFTTTASDGTLIRQTDGTYVALWISGTSIKRQVFDATGVKQGTEFEVLSTGTVISDISAAALKDGTGRTVIAWMEGGAIKKLILKADHTPDGDVQTVDWAGLISESAPKVYALEDGGYSILYKGLEKGHNNNPDQPWYGLHTVRGGQTTAQDEAISPDDAHHATTVLTNAKSVLIYANFPGDLQVESDLNFTFIDRYAPDATEVHHSVTALAGGKFIVTWQDDRSETDTTDVVRAQLFDATHTAEGDLITFTKPAGTILDTTVSQLAGGTLVLVLTMDEAGDKNIYVATRSAAGTVTDPVFVGQSKAGSQTDPAIIPLTDGKYVIGWTNQVDGQAPQFMTEVYGASTTPENTAPQIANLDGDIINTTPGQTVRIDAGEDVLVTDEDPFWLAIHRQDANHHDRLGLIEGGKIHLSDGLKAGSVVSIGTVGAAIAVGEVSQLNQWVLEFHFYDNATGSDVQEILRAVTYTNGFAANDPAFEYEIRFILEDRNHQVASGAVKVSGTPATSSNHAPSEVIMSQPLVLENAAAGTLIGTLSALDPDAGDTTFTYVLLDDAGGRFALSADGKSIVVKNGSLLDYETAHSHTIKVKATDPHGASKEQILSIKLGDVMETVTGATSGKDMLTGAIGADKLSGGYGNDTLTGNGGQDVFVFDSKLGTAKTDRKKNFDTITDFSVGADKIWLDNKIFKKLGKAGSEAAPAALNKKFFKVGTKAKDKDDYLVYNKKTGVLSYDADGKGSKKAVEIMKLTGKPALSADDFFIV